MGRPVWRARHTTLSFNAPRPARRGAASRSGVAIFASDSLPRRAQPWRCRPADGVLWVRFPGLLAGTDLLLAACYLPPQGSGGCPTDLLAWFDNLTSDWAATSASGIPLLAGDFNARTADAPDWPDPEPAWRPRQSCDSARVNPHGTNLLEFCHTTGARILNGRAPNRRGDPSRSATSFGIDQAGSAVVGYFLADPSFFPSFSSLTPRAP